MSSCGSVEEGRIGDQRSLTGVEQPAVAGSRAASWSDVRRGSRSRSRRPPSTAQRDPDSRRLCVTCRMNAQAVFAAKVPTGPQPDRVIALGAQLGSVFGTELVIPSLAVWPSWFDLRIAGPSSGSWAEVSHALKRAGRWTAHDDHGRFYRGAATGSSSSSVGVV